MSAQLHRLIERMAIFIIFVGIIGMFQPWVFAFFVWGFLLVLFGTLGFIVISNITPRNEESVI